MKRTDLLLKLGKRLVQRRDALRRFFISQQGRSSERNRTVGDTVDAALDAEQDELESQLASVESRELLSIEAALDRLRNGEYGVCLSCGKQIPAARLDVLPYAELCVSCQRTSERGRATRRSDDAHFLPAPSNLSRNGTSPSEMELA